MANVDDSAAMVGLLSVCVCEQWGIHENLDWIGWKWIFRHKRELGSLAKMNYISSGCWASIGWGQVFQQVVFFELLVCVCALEEASTG